MYSIILHVFQYPSHILWSHLLKPHSVGLSLFYRAPGLLLEMRRVGVVCIQIRVRNVQIAGHHLQTIQTEERRALVG